MGTFTYEELISKLEQELNERYPDASVELGDGWEYIANIFYELGFEAGQKATK